MAISASALKELNKIGIYTGNKKILSLYTKVGSPGPSLSFKVNTRDFLKEITEGPVGGFLGALAGQTEIGQEAGITGYFDISQRGMFMSVDNLAFDIQGYITVDESLEKSLEQIQKFLPYILPSRTDKGPLTLDEYIEYMNQQAAKSEDSSWAKFSQELFATVADTANKWIGPIYSLNPPDTMNPSIDMDKIPYLKVVWGNVTYYDVLIRSFSMSFPQLYMRASDGKAVPDHIQVQMHCESMRKPALGTRIASEEGSNFVTNISIQ